MCNFSSDMRRKVDKADAIMVFQSAVYVPPRTPEYQPKKKTPKHHDEVLARRKGRPEA